MNAQLFYKLSLSTIQRTFDKLGYVFFSLDKPYNFNLVGIRSNNIESDDFDDIIYCVYKDNNGVLVEHIIEATTDPGLYYLMNPLTTGGTAILCEGQHRGAFQLGLHKGQYKALVQLIPLPVIRDFNKDGILDFNEPTAAEFDKVECVSGRDLQGNVNKNYWYKIWYKNNIKIFQVECTEGGFNLHRSSLQGNLRKVGQYSAGCQVANQIDKYDKLIEDAEKAKSLYGNSFTYTLIRERNLVL